MSTEREQTINPRKLSVVNTASFATIIASIVAKSETAQVTFMHRLLRAVPGEVLAATHRYVVAEIKNRSLAKAA